MRNGVSLLKQYRPNREESRSNPFFSWLAVLAFSLLHPAFGLSPGDTASAFPGSVLHSQFSILHSQFPLLHSQFSLPGARPSPAHARVFTPRHAPEGSYLAFVMDGPMDAARRAVMRALGVADAPSTGSGPWAVRRLETTEAFGDSGDFDETRLARLFNGRRAFVCRGPVSREGRVVASVTLISPYPDPSLSRLEPGTLVIVFDAEAARR